MRFLWLNYFKLRSLKDIGTFRLPQEGKENLPDIEKLNFSQSLTVHQQFTYPSQLGGVRDRGMHLADAEPCDEVLEYHGHAHRGLHVHPRGQGFVY